METCKTCFEQAVLIKLHEGCNYCSSCLIAWCQEQFSQLSTKQPMYIKCLSKGCIVHLHPQQIIDKLGPKQSANIQKTLTTSYLRSSSDVFFCPKQNCNYAGFVTESQLDCKALLTCELCNHQWDHPLVHRVSESAFTRAKSFLYKAFMTKQCPKCQMHIYKISGCNHMTCGFCKSQFPWNRVSYPGRLFCLRILQGTALAASINYREKIMASAKRNKGFVRVVAEILAANLWVGFQCLYHAMIFKQSKLRDKKGKVTLLLMAHLAPFICLGWLSRRYPNLMKRLVRAVMAEVGAGFLMITVAISSYAVSTNNRNRRNRRR